MDYVYALHFLIAVNVAILAIALRRRRPATFIIALNQVLVLKSIINVANLGRPDSQVSVPLWVFSPTNIPTICGIFAVAAAIQLFFALTPQRSVETPASALQPVPKTFLVLFLIYSAVAILSSRTIFQEDYVTPRAWRILGIDLNGLNQLFHALLLYEIVRRVHGRQMQLWKGFAAIFVLFLLTDYLKGSTGQALGFLLATAFFLPTSDSFGGRLTWKRLVILSALLLALFELTFMVRHIRRYSAEGGTDAIAAAVSEEVGTFEKPAAGATGAEDAGLGYQYAAHVFECVSLYDMGRSRGWRSFYQVIEYTLEPSFFGFDRSDNVAVEIQSNFVGNGGCYTAGEFYWNGGYPCVLVGFLLVCGWAFLCDTRYRSGQAWLALACTFVPALMEGIGYGFTNLCRGAINGLWLLLLLRAFRLFGGSRPGTTAQSAPGQENQGTMVRAQPR